MSPTVTFRDGTFEDIKLIIPDSAEDRDEGGFLTFFLANNPFAAQLIQGRAENPPLPGFGRAIQETTLM